MALRSILLVEIDALVALGWLWEGAEVTCGRVGDEHLNFQQRMGLVEDTAARRRRRAEDRWRWRDRLRRGAAVYPVQSTASSGGVAARGWVPGDHL
jgi:hypothetical protein